MLVFASVWLNEFSQLKNMNNPVVYNKFTTLAINHPSIHYVVTVT